MNDVAHTHNQTIGCNSSKALADWPRPVLSTVDFSRRFGRFGDWLYNFTLFFGCAWSIMRSRLFFIPLSFWCHQNLERERERERERKYRKSDNKSTDTKWNYLTGGGLISSTLHRIQKFKKDEEEEALLLLVQLSLLDSTQLHL